MPARTRRPGRRLAAPRRWAWHAQALNALRAHLEEQADSPQATDPFDHEFVRALLAHEADALGEINAALERIRNGRYGICEATGRPIGALSLRARPWVRVSSDWLGPRP